MPALLDSAYTFYRHHDKRTPIYYRGRDKRTPTIRHQRLACYFITFLKYCLKAKKKGHQQLEQDKCSESFWLTENYLLLLNLTNISKQFMSRS